MAEIELRGVSERWGAFTGVDNLSLTIADREFLVLLEPKDRDIAMVFQSYALYPNLTVYEIIRFPL